jgi:hypothetical protein
VESEMYVIVVRSRGNSKVVPKAFYSAACATRWLRTICICLFEFIDRIVCVAASDGAFPVQ